MMPTSDPPSHPAGYHTRRELMSQPAVWAATVEQVAGRAAELAAFLGEGQYTHAVFTGCGSPYYLGLSAAQMCIRDRE